MKDRIILKDGTLVRAEQHMWSYATTDGNITCFYCVAHSAEGPALYATHTQGRTL
jgi:hypothetical protein